ncbi:MAG: hypothetical protein GPJ52_01785 [Candidatus Heimdallarchaeota archaeon]|nr:hypothetical protein [Candidatus Heimdallarchaeota archaeon]
MGLEMDQINALNYIASAIEEANKLKAIELYSKVDAKILEKPEIKFYLKQLADIK